MNAPPPAFDPAADQPIPCPRCAYDLRAATRRWRDQCPLEGRCNECGFEFHWRHVFGQNNHPWLFEHQWSRRPVRAFLVTLLAAFWPWWIWRSVEPHHRVRLGPLIVWAILVTLLAVLLVPPVSIAALRFGAGGFLRELADMPAAVIVLEEIFHAWYLPIMLWQNGCWLPLLWAALMPLTLAIIPDSLGRNQVRLAHVCRLGVYAAAGPIVVAILGSVILESMQGSATAEWARRAVVTLRSTVEWSRFHRLWRLIVPGANAREALAPLVAMTSGVWFYLYWAVALDRYGRVSRPWLTAAGLWTIAFLFVSGFLVLATD